ncbi:MAG: hypothetical protein Cons2KO_24460 [Congregibacter sp.]
MKHTLKLLFILATAATCASQSSVAAGVNLGGLEKYLEAGRDGAWRAAFDTDAYWLENRNDPGAIRYYFGDYDGSLDGRRLIGVDVSLERADSDARAGLLYGFDSDSRNYYLIVLGPDGEVSSYRRDENGVNETMSSRLPGGGKTRRLELRERDAEVEIRVDGRRVSAFEAPGTGRGAVGIAAMGIGRFGFNNFDVRAGEDSYSTSDDKRNSPKTAGKQPSTFQGRMGYKQHTINDEFGFEQSIPAYTVSLPASWSLKGTVQWHGVAECPLELNKLHFMATAPDGKARIEFIPGGAWSWMSLYDSVPQAQSQQSTGCAIKRILDMQSFMQAYIPTIRPDAAVVASRPREDLAQEVLRQAAQSLPPGSPPLNVRVHEVELQYEADGKTNNELLISTVVFSQMRGADPYGGMNGWILMAQAMGSISISNIGSAPDRDLLEKVAESITMQPEYQQRLQQFVDRRSQQMAAATQRRRVAQQQYLASRRAAAAARRASATASTSSTSVGSDILDIQFNGWKSRDRMTSAGQSRVVDGIQDRTAYTNTGGQIVYMPSTYSRMYQLPNDVYVGTNDAFFNPVQATGQFGEELGEHRYGC